jgi:hypothetical protein
VLSWWIFLEGRGARRQLNPGVPAAVVDGNLWRWKFRIGERSHGDTHGLVVPDLGVKDGRTAYGAKPEQELRSLIADAAILRGVTVHLERSREAREGSKNTARASLASKTIADADAARLAFDLNSQLAAGA